MMNNYNIGDCIRVTANFTSSGAPVDPTVVTVRVKTPSSTTSYVYGTDAAVLKDGVGVYHFDIYPSQSGTYIYRFEGTGPAAAALENLFFVNASAFYS